MKAKDFINILLVLTSPLVFLGSFPLVLHAQSRPLQPHILGLAHVAFRVSDFDKSQLFYSSVLGFAEPFALREEEGKIATAYIKVNDLQYIELFSGNTQNFGHLDHLAFYTNDLTAVRAYLKGIGMYIFKDMHKGRIGNPFLTIRDPDGRFIEILQYASDSMTGRSEGAFIPSGRLCDHISHIGLLAHSVEADLKFYHALGFVEFSLAANETKRSSIYLKTADSKEYIELVPSSETPILADTKAQDYLSFACSDAEVTVATLQARAVSESVKVSVKFAADSVPKRAMLLDPDGARIEITEPIPAPSTAGRAATTK
jgi:catechol 2,3-dioxygenase-like lactoylglutathione lyase family enzyme